MSSAHEIRNAVRETGDAPDDEQHEPCPSPLAWHQVLERFRNESTAWELEREGGTIRGRTWGTGRPLYFVNDLAGTHELFALTAWLLRDDFRCVLYDDADRGNLSPEELAADLLAIADRHGDGTIDVYAAGFGSVAALTALHRFPERLGRVVLQSGFAHRRLSTCERLLLRLCRRLRRSLGEMPWRERVQGQNHRPWFPPFDTSRFRFYLETTGRLPVAAAARRAAVVERFDVRDRLREIEQPVLLVGTEGEGRLAEENRRELEAGLPNARTEWLHTCGQLPYLTHPHRLVKLLRSFLLEERNNDDTCPSTGRADEGTDNQNVSPCRTTSPNLST